MRNLIRVLSSIPIRFISKSQRIWLDLKAQLIFDYIHHPITLLFESGGTISALIASAMIAIQGKTVDLDIAFGFYLTSSIALVIAALLRNNSFLIVLNMGYTILNILYFINN